MESLIGHKLTIVKTSGRWTWLIDEDTGLGYLCILQQVVSDGGTVTKTSDSDSK